MQYADDEVQDNQYFLVERYFLFGPFFLENSRLSYQLSDKFPKNCLKLDKLSLSVYKILFIFQNLNKLAQFLIFLFLFLSDVKVCLYLYQENLAFFLFDLVECL